MKRRAALAFFFSKRTLASRDIFKCITLSGEVTHAHRRPRAVPSNATTLLSATSLSRLSVRLSRVWARRRCSRGKRGYANHNIGTAPRHRQGRSVLDSSCPPCVNLPRYTVNLEGKLRARNRKCCKRNGGVVRFR